MDEDSKLGELVWDPSALSTESVNTFLSDTKDHNDQPASLGSLPVPRQEVSTQEDALNTLHRNGYDLDKAKEELKSLPWKHLLTTQGTHQHLRCLPILGSWSRREVDIFSSAMDSHYKRFHAICKLFFPYKSTQEVVEYYYFWKITTDTENQKDFDEISSQSEELDELALRSSSSMITKRKRDTFQDPFHGDSMFGWGNFDNFRRGEPDDGPPLKRSKSDELKLSTDSFFAREDDSQVKTGLNINLILLKMHPFHKNSFTSQNHDIFSNSSELNPWAEFLTFPPYTSPVSSILPDVDHFLEDASLSTLSSSVLGDDIGNLPFDGSGLT